MDGQPAEPLTDWLDRQQQCAVERLFGAVSATHLIKQRPGFGQVITPAPGSVLASPADANWDPEPDYFFHWLRDGALAMEAVRLLRASPQFGQLAEWELEQYVNFSLRLAELDGAARLAETPLWHGVATAFLQYVRDPDEVLGLRGDVVRGDVRFNPDGTLDITRWSRPQYDGVALRALGLLRCVDRRQTPEWAELIADDLDCVARNAGRPCVDLWEEEEGFHCHTMLTQYAALRAGAAVAGTSSPMAATARRQASLMGRARLWEAAAEELWRRLDGLRRPEDAGGWIISRVTAAGGAPVSEGKLLDASVILGVIHAGLEDGPFSLSDPLVHGTLLRLEAHYAAAFALNRRLSPHCAPHLGRNPADVYFDGGAWPLITLAAAELRYRLAAAVARGRAPERIAPALWFGEAAEQEPGVVARLLLRAGDMGLASVRAVTPADGAMAEQADRETGAPRSARNLTWSYAAFLTAVAARGEALDAMGSDAPGGDVD